MDGTAFFFNLIFPLSVTDHSSGLKCTLQRKELLDGSQSALATRCCHSFLSFGSRGKHFIIYPFSLRLWHPTAAQPGIFDHPNMKMNLQIKNNGETALLLPNCDRISMKSQHRAQRRHDDTTTTRHQSSIEHLVALSALLPVCPFLSFLAHVRLASLYTSASPKVHPNEQTFHFISRLERRDQLSFSFSFYFSCFFLFSFFHSFPPYRDIRTAEKGLVRRCSRIARYLEHSRRTKRRDEN